MSSQSSCVTTLSWIKRLDPAVFLMLFMISASAGLFNEAKAQTWFASGSRPQDYDMGGDPMVEHGASNAGYVRSKVSSINGFGTWMTKIEANEWRGHGLRLSAWVKTVNVADIASLWMRIETNGRTTTFDNMSSRAISGDTDWQEYEIILDVEEKSTDIFFGIMIRGTGEMTVDGLKLEAVERTWIPQNSRMSDFIFCVDAVDEKCVWVGAASGRYARTLDGGETWQPGTIKDAGSINILSLCAVNADTAFLAGTPFGSFDTRIYKTGNGGESWTLQYQNKKSGAFINSIAFWDKDHGLAVSDPINGQYLILKTTNGGVDWSEIPTSNIPPPPPDEFSGFGDAGGKVLAVNGEKYAWFGTAYNVENEHPVRIYRSTDAGEHWRVVDTPLSKFGQQSGITSLAFKDSLVGFAAASGCRSEDGVQQNLIKTTDGGKTWELVDPFLPLDLWTLLYVPQTNDSVLFTTSQQGCGFSLDGGATWQAVGSTQSFSGADFAGPTAGWAAGANGRMGKLMPTMLGVETGIKNVNRVQGELSFVLAQNYPNPFNPTTTISFTLSSPQQVSLDVYTLNGRKIQTLLTGFMPAGDHSVLFDGHELPSGIYLYQLQAGEQLSSRKMTMMK